MMQLTLNNEGSGEIYLKIMKAICGDVSDKSVVDLMCHKSPYTPQLGFKYRTYVDILDRKLDDKKEQQYFIQSDVIDFLTRGNMYDVSLVIDGIEHLQKERAKTLIRLMEYCSDKQIIFVPLGAYMVEKKSINPDTHKSSWMPEDFDGWAKIVMPKFHPQLKIGAFFSFRCLNLEQEFERVKNELKQIL